MAERELYKGIEFVRISKLPKDQSERIRSTFPKEKIIKILRDEVILSDCIQYQDYQEWLRQFHQSHSNIVSENPERVRINSFNMAVK